MNQHGLDIMGLLESDIPDGVDLIILDGTDYNQVDSQTWNADFAARSKRFSYLNGWWVPTRKESNLTT